MSGVALTIRSPSSSRISRSVVCVAGCWGPKLSVQVNGFGLGAQLRVRRASWPASIWHLRWTAVGLDGDLESTAVGSRGRDRCRSRLAARQPREVVPLAAAAERIVLPEREGGELVGHQDPPQVGMAGEA